MTSPQTVPQPSVRSLPAGPDEPVPVVVPAQPGVVPAPVVIDLQRSYPEVARRMTFAQARAALTRLGHEDDAV